MMIFICEECPGESPCSFENKDAEDSSRGPDECPYSKNESIPADWNYNSVESIELTIHGELEIWNAQVLSEEIGGNLIKENFARGKVAGLRAALSIIQNKP